MCEEKGRGLYMDYIRQHTQAFKCLKKSGLGAQEWLIYSEIFSRANKQWDLALEVEIAAVELATACGIKNNDTLRIYRKKLIDAGMIEYRPGSGRGSKGVYKLVDLTGGVSGRLKGTVSAAAEQAMATAEAVEAPAAKAAPEPTAAPVVETAPEPNPTKRTRRKRVVEKPVMKAHGTYNNVMLSDLQYEKLVAAHGKAVAEAYIEKVGDYIYRKPEHAFDAPRGYKDLLRTINKWIAKDKAQGTFRAPAPAVEAPAALPAATDAERAAAAAIMNAEDDIFKAARAARMQDWQQ